MLLARYEYASTWPRGILFECQSIRGRLDGDTACGVQRGRMDGKSGALCGLVQERDNLSGLDNQNASCYPYVQVQLH
jgi:hypothetical protein